MKKIRSRAPIRIDFAGGTTDLAAFRNREGGAVVSAAVSRYAYCSLQAGEGGEIRIKADDLEQYVRAANIRELEFDGNLDLLKGAVKALELPHSLDIYVHCDAPPGSGTGSSASVGVALIGLLNHLRLLLHQSPQSLLSRFDIAELACRIEQDLGIVGGKQDQYAAALGGFNYIQFYSDDRVAVEPLLLSNGVLCELSKRLILYYTGQSRLSGSTNQRMIEAYESGDPVVGGALRTIKQTAQEIYRALLGEDLEAFGELLNQEWRARCQLAPGVVTEQMQEVRQVALAAGALATKVCGAGGGGCMLIYCDDDREGPVRRALAGQEGSVLDINFDFTGLQVWEGR
ncbi:MAG TPA: GHMP kinase [Armatimonadota bacterium]|jgi:D-glycero-alpha-D-manno-heptose-7-phosphate kinase